MTLYLCGHSKPADSLLNLTADQQDVTQNAESHLHTENVWHLKTNVKETGSMITIPKNLEGRPQCVCPEMWA